MPLEKGSSSETRSKNVREMVDSYKSTGRIGNSRPASNRKAIKQAVAAAYRQQRKSRSKKRGTR